MAKKKLCKDVENIKLYMIRSLQREYEKYRLSDNADALANIRCEISRANKARASEYQRYIKVRNEYSQFRGAIIEMFGSDAYSKIRDMIRDEVR